MTTIKALSIKPPWPHFILADSPERKDFENRRWLTHYRGPFLVHASRSPDRNWRELLAQAKALKGIDVSENAPCGCILGISTIVDCVHENKVDRDDPQYFWFQGPFGFKLANSKPFSVTIPYAGRLGWFDVALEGIITAEINKLESYAVLSDRVVSIGLFPTTQAHRSAADGDAGAERKR